MPVEEVPDVFALFADDELISKALADAVRETVVRHKLLGQPMVEYRDGKTIWVPADQIEIDGDSTKS